MTVSTPIRTCVGCGGKAAQAELVRLAAEEARVVVDRARRLGGRGAWLHASEACLERALKRRVFARALRLEGASADAVALRVGLTGSARKD